MKHKGLRTHQGNPPPAFKAFKTKKGITKIGMIPKKLQKRAHLAKGLRTHQGNPPPASKASKTKKGITKIRMIPKKLH